MKSVDTIARIRREFFLRGRSIKEIAREPHVALNTVRKVLRSGETISSHGLENQPLPKLGPWTIELTGCSRRTQRRRHVSGLVRSLDVVELNPFFADPDEPRDLLGMVHRAEKARSAKKSSPSRRVGSVSLERRCGRNS